MAWHVERPFFPEEVRQAVVRNMEVKNSQTTDKRKMTEKLSKTL
jgi:hypothetical protein